jgi:hypothetical protein
MQTAVVFSLASQAEELVEAAAEPSKDKKRQPDEACKPSVVYDSAILGALHPMMRENEAIDRDKWMEDESEAVSAARPRRKSR